MSTLLEQARDAQKRVNADLDVITDKRRSEHTLKQSQFEKLQIIVSKLETIFKDKYLGKPIRAYELYHRHDGFTFGSSTNRLEFEKQSQGWNGCRVYYGGSVYELTNGGMAIDIRLAGTSNYNLMITISLDGSNAKPVFRIVRQLFTANECLRWLDIKPNHSWTCDPPFKNKQAVFNTQKAFLEAIDAFVCETLDIEQYEKDLNQSEKQAILRGYLNLGDDTPIVLSNDSANNIGHRFKVLDKDYRIIEQADVVKWYSQLVAFRPLQFLNVGLLAKNSAITATSWSKLIETLSKDDLKEVISKMVRLDAFAKDVAKDQDFSKLVADFKGVYVIDCNRFDS